MVSARIWMVGGGMELKIGEKRDLLKHMELFLVLRHDSCKLLAA